MESVELDKCGLLRINGWARKDLPSLDEFSVRVDGHAATSLNLFRTYRHDISVTNGIEDRFCGFVIECVLYPSGSEKRDITNVDVGVSGVSLFRWRNTMALLAPHYGNLFSEKEILHRDRIYGSGPPSSSVGPDILALAGRLRSPVIDFGCGNGTLVKTMRLEGIETYGIEVQMMERFCLPESLPFVKHYDGLYPLPFDDHFFESGISVEVLEHLPDPHAAVKELARIIRKRLIITVPDMSSIPILHQHRVVPWHLLEATHVNFFTQESLLKLLEPHFTKIEFARRGAGTINGTIYYTSLVAIADK